jgi:hypothetical protein
MALKSRDKLFRLPKVSLLDFKSLEMDRVLTMLFARIHHKGEDSRLFKKDNTVDTFEAHFLSQPNRISANTPTSLAAGYRLTSWTSSIAARQGKKPSPPHDRSTATPTASVIPITAATTAPLSTSTKLFGTPGTTSANAPSPA